jgi:hypothetical protein
MVGEITPGGVFVIHNLWERKSAGNGRGFVWAGMQVRDVRKQAGRVRPTVLSMGIGVRCGYSARDTHNVFRVSAYRLLEGNSMTEDWPRAP